jgi:glycosyltransferase involved in cell wall biosynthesis
LTDRWEDGTPPGGGNATDALVQALRASRLWPVARAAYAFVQTLKSVPRSVTYWRALRGVRHDRRPDSDEVVMLVVSDIRSDPRVEREARALAAAGFRVKVIWPDSHQPRHADAPIDWGPGISFRPAPAGAGRYVIAFPWVWGGALHRIALTERPFAFHSHDLNTALAALSAARKANAYFVADFHEWFSENVHWNAWKKAWLPHGPWKRALFRAVERLTLRQADEVVTVGDEIARELRESVYPRRKPVRVVRNIPSFAAQPTREYEPLKRALGIPEHRFMVLWQGGVGPTRMIEPLVEALALAPRMVLVVRGPGVERYGAAYRELAARTGTADRLILLPPVPSPDVVAAARGADAGVWTLPNWCKNFYYALPNKIFEYLAAGLPVLAADFPEARRVVAGYEVGLCFDPYDPASIATQVHRMIDNPLLVQRFRDNVPAALHDMRAEREWEKLAAVYRELAAEAGVRLGAPAARAAR